MHDNKGAIHKGRPPFEGGGGGGQTLVMLKK